MEILTFFYIFDFYLIKDVSITSSSYLVFLILFMLCVVKPKYNREVVIMLGSRYNMFIVISLGVLIFAASIWTCFSGAFDFSYATTLIHQLLCIEIGVLLVSYYKFRKVDPIRIVIRSFFIQSLIQLFSFFSSTFLSITDHFRSSTLIYQRVKSYDGYRGLAIAGTNFFGLAVAYAIVFIVIAFYWGNWSLPVPKKIIVCLCLCFGALSAGRTSVLGIAGFLIILAYKGIKRLNNLRVLRNIGVSILLFFAVYVFFRAPIERKLESLNAWTSLKKYLFQVFGEDGNLSSFSIENSSSLNQLVNDYYFPISVNQFFFGDGKYTDGNSYYMNTDAGYMRNVLYWGIFMTGALFLYQYRFISFFAKKRAQKVISFAIFLALAIFEYKGQTVGFLIISQSLLLIIACNLNSFSDKANEGDILA